MRRPAALALLASVAAACLVLSLALFGRPVNWALVAFRHRTDRQCYVPDAELGYALRAPFSQALPGGRGRVSHLPFPGADASGYRRSVGNAPAQERTDILALGDSFAYALFVADEAAWISRLGRLCGLRAATLGVPGYGTSQAVGLYRRHAAAFRPRLVLLLPFFNDPWDNVTYHNWRALNAENRPDFRFYQLQKGLQWPAWICRLLLFSMRHSLLAYQLGYRLIAVRVSRRSREDSAAAARGMRLLCEDVEALARALAAEGRGFAVVINAHWAGLAPAGRAKLRDFLKRRRIPFLDLGDSPVWRYSGNRLHIQGDGHWTELGNALVAAEIYRFACERGLLTRRGGARSTSGSPRCPAARS